MRTRKLNKDIFVIKYYIVNLIRNEVEALACNNTYIN